MEDGGGASIIDVRAREESAYPSFELMSSLTWTGPI